MPRGPLAHAAKSSGYDGESQFVECTCGARFAVKVDATAHPDEQFDAINNSYAEFKRHESGAAR